MILSSRSETMRAPRLALLLLGLGALGCSSEADRPRWRGAVPVTTTPSDSTGGGGEGGSPSPTGTGGSSAACEDGETRSCQATLSEHEGIRLCLLGTETCEDGAWGPCEGSFSDRSEDFDGASGMVPLAHSASTDCVNNACDPTCQVFPEAPPSGETFAPLCTGSATAGGETSSLPGGFSNKLLKDYTSPPGKSGCSTAADCQADTYCDPTVCDGSTCGKCVPWADGDYDPSLSQPNYTMRTPCDGNVIVCNRGGITAPAGVDIHITSGNSSKLQKDLGSCSSLSASVAATCSTAAPIPPGECIAVSGCGGLSGTKGVVINHPALASPVRAESDCSDNWAVHGTKASATCKAGPEQAEATETYEATCPDDMAPQWGYLAYDASLPAGAEVELWAQTAPTAADLDAACSGCVLLADIPNSEPASCSFGGPSPCPINLFDSLGGLPSARDNVLELRWRMRSNALCEAPVIDNWDVVYSCVDVQ